MRVGSMNRLPEGKRPSIIVSILGAILLAFFIFIFMNLIISVGKIVVAFVIKNYVVIIIIIIVLLVLRRLIFRKKNVLVVKK